MNLDHLWLPVVITILMIVQVVVVVDVVPTVMAPRGGEG